MRDIDIFPYFELILPLKTEDRIDINIYPKDICLTQNVIGSPHFISTVARD